MRLLQKINKSEGYAVAEFAVTLPALLGVVGIGFWTLGLAVNKFEQENLTSNAARILARGEDLPTDYFNNEQVQLSFEVIESNSRVRVTTQMLKTIPIIEKQIELNASAESLSETYEYQE